MLVTQGLLGIGDGISAELNGVWKAIGFLSMTQKGKWALLGEYLGVTSVRTALSLVIPQPKDYVSI